MIEELRILSDEKLINVSEADVSSIIKSIAENTKENMEERALLVSECSAILFSSRNRSEALRNQGIFKKVLNELTGKNAKIRDAILADENNALYLTQEIINTVIKDNKNMADMIVLVNDRLNDVVLRQNRQDEINAEIWDAMVDFFNQFTKDSNEKGKAINNLIYFSKERCPECNRILLQWQRICPYCGTIHSLKTGDLDADTKAKLSSLSQIMKNNTIDNDIAWHAVAQKKEWVLRKVKLMSEMGESPWITEVIKHDVDSLIAQCKNAEFQIAIVGVVKAGKSFLMNALIGAEIASVCTNPETAVLTKFKAADHNRVIVRFHNKKEWAKLKNSANKSDGDEDNSLKRIIQKPKTQQLEKEWIGHKDLTFDCDSIENLGKVVKQYTSSQNEIHIVVSEVEAWIDRKVFNMPDEVVFVDTPGLEDPVAYRSNITKAYIKNANAVLIAVPVGVLTNEGRRIIFSTLQLTDLNKALIVATQKDKFSREDCEVHLNDWAEQLVEAGTFKNLSIARDKIIPTAAKPEVLLKQFLSMDDEEREQKLDSTYFKELASEFAEESKSMKYGILSLLDDVDMQKKLKQSFGIDQLQHKLYRTLISKHEKLKIDSIERVYKRIKNEITNQGSTTINERLEEIRIAQEGKDALLRKIKEEENNKKILEKQRADIKQEVEMLKESIDEAIIFLERGKQ